MCPFWSFSFKNNCWRRKEMTWETGNHRNSMILLFFPLLGFNSYCLQILSQDQERDWEFPLQNFLSNRVSRGNSLRRTNDPGKWHEARLEGREKRDRQKDKVVVDSILLAALFTGEQREGAENLFLPSPYFIFCHFSFQEMESDASSSMSDEQDKKEETRQEICSGGVFALLIKRREKERKMSWSFCRRMFVRVWVILSFCLPLCLPFCL